MLPSSLKAVAGISSSIITKIKQSLFAGSQFLDSNTNVFGILNRTFSVYQY
jgi:hypothetical protein